jgi:hypothetical protein
MPAKTQKANCNKRKAQPVAQKLSPLRSALIGTVFNMATITAAFGAVLLCFVVAKHFV